MSSSRALTVGLVIARHPETLSADPFFPAFIAGIEMTLAERGQALLLQVVPDQESERRNYETLAASGRVDGVFLTDLRVEDPRADLLESLGLPGVVIAPAPIACRWPVVAVDDRPGIVAAVEHLVALGHRRIAHVAGPEEFVHSRSRQQAWADTLASSGLEESPCVWSDFSPSGGAQATNELLDLPEPPTAIVYANDLMAIAGTSAAQARGLHVPDAFGHRVRRHRHLGVPAPTADDGAHRRGRLGPGRRRMSAAARRRRPQPRRVAATARPRSSAPPPHHRSPHHLRVTTKAHPLVPHGNRNGSRMNAKKTTTIGLSLLYSP